MDVALSSFSPTLNVNVRTIISHPHEPLMPLLRPIPIPTKKVNFFVGIFNWLTYIRQWEIAGNYVMYIEYLDTYVLIPGTYIDDKNNQTPGFIFDGASVPKIFTNLLSPTGILFLPGLLHDFGYKYRCLLTPSGLKIHEGESQAFFDKLFDKVSLQVNGMKVPSYTAYLALRSCGFVSWNKHRKANSQIEIDFPHLALSLIESEQILPLV